jgi:hypothetical protein
MVYCKNGSRRGSFEHEAFPFLGYTFRATRNRTRHGRLFLSFEPAVSQDALKRIGREVRSWQLHTRSDLSFNELARWVNPMVAGWINYFDRFRPWEPHPLEAVVFPDLRTAFPLVGHRVGDPVGVVACRAVAAREVVDAVGGWAVGTA